MNPATRNALYDFVQSVQDHLAVMHSMPVSFTAGTSSLMELNRKSIALKGQLFNDESNTEPAAPQSQLLDRITIRLNCRHIVIRYTGKSDYGSPLYEEVP